MYGAKIFVAHAIRPEPPLTVPLDPLPLEAGREWQQARLDLAEFLARNPLEGVAHEEILLRGDLWDVISSVIEKNEIDLLVLGTRGLKGLKKLAMGSGAEKIYRQALCPVLTVGPSVAATSKPHLPKRILFPTDLSESSLRALPYALSLAEENQANLIFLHVVPLVPWQEQASTAETSRKRLQSLVPKEAEAWCRPEFVVRFDFPVESILSLAEQARADLIVMGVKKSAGISVTSHLPWTTASEVVSRAPCLVLTVRG